VGCGFYSITGAKDVSRPRKAATTIVQLTAFVTSAKIFASSVAVYS
jgi:hypothetical protein